MAEKPIIFSGPMVRAILDGRKTMTRRILKPQPKEPVRVNGVWYDRAKGGDGKPLRLPYAVGDRLWVREVFRHIHSGDRGYGAQYRADKPDDWRDQTIWLSPIHMPRWASRITLTVTAVKVERVQDISDEDARAEGITYQEPTAADLEWFKGWQEENCRDPNEPMDGIWTSGIKDTWGPTAQSAFMMLWRHIHGPGAWDRNDWVAAISFERTNADQA